MRADGGARLAETAEPDQHQSAAGEEQWNSSVIDDAIEGRGTFRGIRRHARIEQHDDRRTLFFGYVGGAGGFDDVGENEVDIGCGQDMPDIVDESLR
jgi:hypothetical protein